MDKRKRGRLIDSLRQLSSEIKSNTVVELHCSGVVYITGCEKITVYTENYVEMKCSDATVCFDGENLRLKNLINGQISVIGKVKAVNFKND